MRIVTSICPTDGRKPSTTERDLPDRSGTPSRYGDRRVSHGWLTDWLGWSKALWSKACMASRRPSGLSLAASSFLVRLAL